MTWMLFWGTAVPLDLGNLRMYILVWGISGSAGGKFSVGRFSAIVLEPRGCGLVP